MMKSSSIIFVILIILDETLADHRIHDNETMVNSYNILNKGELKVLAKLPLEKLLKVKYSMDDLTEKDPYSLKIPEILNNNSEAMALTTEEEDPIRRTDYLQKTKGGKINKFFALSVTTLAFLAFGGYLLCLIVQAIKNKSTYGYDPSVSATSQPVMVVQGTIKKKRPQFNYGRKKRDAWDELDSDQMYNVMIKLAEGYATWNGLK